MGSIIRPDDVWLIWGIITFWVGSSIYLEKKYRWAARLTGPVLALVGAILLSNLKIVPMESASYDFIWEYIVPISLPLLLLKANLFRIIKETGSMFGAFHLSALGTVIGAFLAGIIFSGLIPFSAEIAGIMTGSYIGGGVNFIALTETFSPPKYITGALIVADNMIMVTVFLILVAIPSMSFFRKHFGRTQDIGETTHNLKETAKDFWKSKRMSLKDIALGLAIAVIISALAMLISDTFKLYLAPGFLQDVLTNKFLLITTLSVAVATIFHRSIEEIQGAEELGVYLIYLFFFVLGVPADIMKVILNAPLLFVFCALIALLNLGSTFILGKLFKLKLEELTLVVSGTLGGPMTALALATAKGWNKLMLPALLTGIWGYVIGTYLGILSGNLLKSLL